MGLIESCSINKLLTFKQQGAEAQSYSLFHFRLSTTRSTQLLVMSGALVQSCTRSGVLDTNHSRHMTMRRLWTWLTKERDCPHLLAVPKPSTASWSSAGKMELLFELQHRLSLVCYNLGQLARQSIHFISNEYTIVVWKVSWIWKVSILI